MVRAIIFILVIMLKISSLQAQVDKVNSLAWERFATLPPVDGQASIGIAGPVTGVHNHVLMVGGGANFPSGMPWEGGKKRYYDQLFIYNISSNNPECIAIGSLPQRLAYAASCTTSQGVVVAGGENESGINKKAWLLKWDSRKEKIIYNDLPDLPVALTNAMASVHNDKVYIAGGDSITGTSASFYVLDLHQLILGWKQLPSIPVPVSNAVLVSMEISSNANNSILQGSKKVPVLLLLGGRKKNFNGISDLYSSVYAYDIVQQGWKKMKDLPYALSAGTGVAINHSVLLFGGDKGESFSKTEQLIADISNEKDTIKRKRLEEEKAMLQSSHPGFSKEILEYDPVTGISRVIGMIPFDAPVTTIATRCGENIFIPSGETRAGVRTPFILKVSLKKSKDQKK